MLLQLLLNAPRSSVTIAEIVGRRGRKRETRGTSELSRCVNGCYYDNRRPRWEKEEVREVSHQVEKLHPAQKWMWSRVRTGSRCANWSTLNENNGLSHPAFGLRVCTDIHVEAWCAFYMFTCNSGAWSQEDRGSFEASLLYWKIPQECVEE